MALTLPWAGQVIPVLLPQGLTSYKVNSSSCACWARDTDKADLGNGNWHVGRDLHGGKDPSPKPAVSAMKSKSLILSSTVFLLLMSCPGSEVLPWF